MYSSVQQYHSSRAGPVSHSDDVYSYTSFLIIKEDVKVFPETIEGAYIPIFLY